MKSIEIMQHTDSDKILRFLDRNGLLKTLGITLPKMPRQIIDRGCQTKCVKAINKVS